MIVKLSHAKNPDIAGGYWTQPSEPGKAKKVAVADYAQAAKACREYIEKNALGGGNWTGGQITADKGKTEVARVSFNGRVWANDGKEIQI